MTSIRIVGFAGSLRQGSFNKKLVAEALEGARAAGAEVENLDLADFEAPIYNGDIENAEGLPAGILAFKERLKAADGMLISSPEHNASISPVLKNMIDWASRPTSSENPDHCFAGKTAGLLATSPGRLGGIRGLEHLRAILLNLKVLVIPTQYSVPGAHNAFGEDDCLAEEHVTSMTHAVGAELVRITSLLKAGS